MWFLPHQRHGLGLQHLRAVERAVVQQHLQELHVVPRRREQRTAAHEEFRPLRHLEIHRLERAVALRLNIGATRAFCEELIRKPVSVMPSGAKMFSWK